MPSDPTSLLPSELHAQELRNTIVSEVTELAKSSFPDAMKELGGRIKQTSANDDITGSVLTAPQIIADVLISLADQNQFKPDQVLLNRKQLLEVIPELLVRPGREIVAHDLLKNPEIRIKLSASDLVLIAASYLRKQQRRSTDSPSEATETMTGLAQLVYLNQPDTLYFGTQLIKECAKDASLLNFVSASLFGKTDVVESIVKQEELEVNTFLRGCAETFRELKGKPRNAAAAIARAMVNAIAEVDDYDAVLDELNILSEEHVRIAYRKLWLGWQNNPTDDYTPENVNYLSKGFGISISGLEIIAGKAAAHGESTASDDVFISDVLADPNLSNADKVAFIWSYNATDINNYFLSQAISLHGLKYHGSEEAWNSMTETWDNEYKLEVYGALADAPSTILAPLMAADIKEGNDSKLVLALLKVHGANPEYLPIWREALRFLDTSDVLDTILSLHSIPHELAILQFEYFNNSEKEKNLSLRDDAYSHLLLANIPQSDQVRALFHRRAELQTDARISARTELLRSHPLSLNLPAEIQQSLVPHKPTTLEILARVALSIASEPGGVTQILSRGPKFRSFASLLISIPDMVVAQFMTAAAEVAAHGKIDRQVAKSSSALKVWPVPNGPEAGSLPKVSRSVALKTMAIIGGGPAAILAARYREELGYFSEATTIFAAAKDLGGIWQQENVVNEGHNIFRNTSIFGATLSADEPRPGSALTNFLKDLRTRTINSHVKKAVVTAVEYDKRTGKYEVFSTTGSLGTFDNVLICTGNREPRPLNSRWHMSTNVKADSSLAVERWQRQLSLKDYKELQDTTPLIVGLGNSTMAMIGEFQKMQGMIGEFQKMQGEDFVVHPKILTHLPLERLLDPTAVARERLPGTTGSTEYEYHPPIYRDPSALHRIAGDIPRIAERLEYALERGWIVPNVRSWNILPETPDSLSDGRSFTYEDSSGKTTTVHNVSRVWALIGYRNNANLMRSLGCQCSDDGEVQFDPLSGRVHEQEGGGRGLFIAGAAAATRNDRNHEVIPGMLDSIPRTMFHVVLKDIASE
jgi:hypothetical protein